MINVRSAIISVVATLSLVSCKTSLVPKPLPPAVPLEDISSLRLKVAKAPDDSKILAALGSALVDQSASEAAKLLRRALQRDPSSDAWKSLATLYETRGYIDRQLEVLDARYRYAPDDLDAIVALVRLYNAIGARSDAEVLLKKALNMAPQDSRVSDVAVLVYYRTLRFKPAITALNAQIETIQSQSAVNQAKIWHRLSELQRADEQWLPALASVIKAISLDVNNPEYYRQNAHILATQPDRKRDVEGLTAADKAIALGDTSIDIKYWHAVLLEHTGRLDAAIGAYQEVATEDVAYERTAFQLGQLLIKRGQIKEGKELLKVYDVANRNEKELNYAGKRLIQRPNDPANHIKLIQYSIITQEYGRATVLVKRAQKKFPLDKRFQPFLINALEGAGRVTEAALAKKQGR